MKNYSEVVTLCGSRKFANTFRQLEWHLSRLGIVVLSPILIDNREITATEAQLFGQLHLKKIDLAVGIFVVDVNGYVGESTKKEIAYAKLHHKKVWYYSAEKDDLGL
ncbi:MAG: hypothetical protein LKE89_09630 [Lactobacillaceae bacterium]|jgi:hypothetical protein|nr:hypothetical protein [Lactobacillaceae bacterium]